MTPQFSIIVPCFNARDKLSRTLDSVLSQTADFELLVQDGDSRDGTRELLRDYAQRDSRLHFQSEPDQGIYDAMNRGIANARGRWLYFLGAGDTLRPDALETIGHAAREVTQELALIYGDVWLCDQARVFGGRFSPSKLRNWNPPHQGIFYNRALFARFGPYELRYRIAADYAFNLRVWGAREVEKRYLPVAVADYEGGGLSAQQRDDAFARDFAWLLRSRLGRSAYFLRRVERFAPAPLKKLRVGLLRKLARRESRAK